MIVVGKAGANLSEALFGCSTLR